MDADPYGVGLHLRPFHSPQPYKVRSPWLPLPPNAIASTIISWSHYGFCGHYGFFKENSREKSPEKSREKSREKGREKSREKVGKKNLKTRKKSSEEKSSAKSAWHLYWTPYDCPPSNNELVPQ